MVGDNVMVIKICDPPVSSQADLTKRFKAGVQIARNHGMEYIIVVESDDFYPAGYVAEISKQLKTYDAFGYGSTYYYHIRNRTWQRSFHQDTHSSLFCTAFKISLLDDFRWPPDEHLWLDLELWKHFRGKNAFLSEDDPPCIGIKHGVGKVGGKAHKWEMKNSDPYLEWLKSRVDATAFEFYSKLKL
jgi:hypothetical protein